jgi:mycothiol system anti-sigma-R factor
MNCEQVVEHLWSFLDGELDVAASDELKQHLDECRQCFSRAEFERRLRTLVRQSCEGEPAPVPLQERMRRLIRSF